MDKWQEWHRIIKDLMFPLLDIINVKEKYFYDSYSICNRAYQLFFLHVCKVALEMYPDIYSRVNLSIVTRRIKEKNRMSHFVLYILRPLLISILLIVCNYMYKLITLFIWSPICCLVLYTLDLNLWN